MTINCFALIDPDPRRRSLVCDRLAGASMFVAQFSWVREIDPEKLEHAVLLALDKGQAIADIVNSLEENLLSNPIIAYSDRIDTDRVVQAVKAGADGYLAWPFTMEQLTPVIERIESEASQATDKSRVEARSKYLIKQLTPREREVLSGVVHGMSNQQIGDALSISARTVEIHRANMIRKLGASNSAAAVKMALDGDFKDAPPASGPLGDWLGEAA